MCAAGRDFARFVHIGLISAHRSKLACLVAELAVGNIPPDHVDSKCFHEGVARRSAKATPKFQYCGLAAPARMK